MTRNWTYVFILLLVAVAIRLYPYLVSGLPFSLDAWAPIRNTELLLKNSPISLGDNIFDGYHSYWPANSLFSAVVSEVTSLPPMQTMAVYLPLAGATAILIFYVLVKRIFNAKIAFMASLIFATAFTHAYFTAGVTKETYANPLYLSLILIFLHPAIGKQKQVLLFAVTAAALALTHHFTIIISIAILSGIALARLINNTKKGLAPNRSDFLLTSILIIFAALYFGLFAYRGFIFPITYSDWLSAVSYQILAFALAVYFTSKPSFRVRTRTLITALGAIAASFLFTLLFMRRPLVLGASAVPQYYLLYNLPYVILIPLITLGYGYQRQSKASVAPLFWLTAIIGLEGYAVFSNSSLSLALASRGINFLYPPMAIFSAVGLYRLYGMAKKPSSKRFMKLAVSVTVIVIAALNSYSLYASVSLQERYMGYMWLYKTQEYGASDWVATRTSSVTVAGDIKVYHLLQDYFTVNVDVLQGYRYLTEESEPQPQILYVYSQMATNGYILGWYGTDLPENWIQKTTQLNQIYSNGLASLSAKPS